MKDIKISIDEQSALFKKHLDEEDNERIIFSAPFGAGKTYFLREFLNTNATEYLAVKLAPVNYSIASNEDIFRFIKFDILFELLAHHGAKQPGKIKIRPDIFYGLKLAEKADGFFTSIATLFGTLNKDVKEATEVITALATLHSQITEFASTSREIEENPELNAFVKQLMDSYYKEADEVTSFIEIALNQLSKAPEPKEGEASTKDRKKALVIDDLDRLDPEHIFRLFNIFSAHFDYNQSNKNKFGFDKVIFVCDIQNIRNIFRSRYGTETDFSGYIDKFFSQEIFYFNNENAIKEYVNILLKSIRLEPDNDFVKNYFEHNILQGANHTEKWITFWTLFELINSGALKPRRIYSPHKAWDFPKGHIVVWNDNYSRDIAISSVPAIVAIQLLSSILGGGEQLLQALKYAAGQPRSIEYRNLSDRPNYIMRLTGSLLIVDYTEHLFKTHNDSRQPQQHIYTGPDGKKVEYFIGQDSARHELYQSYVRELQGLSFFELLPVMVQKLLKDKKIK
jgi:hypothetical protein